MKPFRSPVVMSMAVAAALVGSACGSDGGSANDDAATPEATTTTSITAPEAEPDADNDDENISGDADDTNADEENGDEHADDEDHDDEDHDDEDHDDEDHDDEEHDDEDHDDEDHDDEDHGDEEHGDDHDDHDDSSGLGAHEHGTAELSVAWIGNEVAIDLISPTFNVFGFEYEPTSDEDIAIESDRTDVLTSSGVVRINDEADCALVDPVSTEVERDGTHSEITVSWLFDCQSADEISQVDVSGLFAEFPNFDDIDVQWISDSQQSSAELSPTETAVSLQR